MATTNKEEVIKRTDEGAIAASPTGESEFDQLKAVISKGDMETPKPEVDKSQEEKPPSVQQTENPKHPTSDIPEGN